MEKILIRIKPGHQLAGAGEPLGKDLLGHAHTFWKAMGHMEVPPDLAVKLEKEMPQRFEMVDRNLAKTILGAEKKQEEKPKVPIQPVPPTSPKPVEKKPEPPKVPDKKEKGISEKDEKRVEELKKAAPKEEGKRGILNIHTVDNYMDKNTKGMFNDIDEDKPYLSLEDLKLMEDYEKKHNKRKAVLDKIQETIFEIKKKLKVP